MPIYDYKCRKCGEVFEKLVKNREQQVHCKNCGDSHVKRLMSTFSVGSSTSTAPAPSCPMAASGQCGGCH